MVGPWEDYAKTESNAPPWADYAEASVPQQSYQDRRLALVQSPEFKSASLDQRKAMMSKFLDAEVGGNEYQSASPPVSSKEYGAKLAQTPEYRAMAAKFIRKEGQRNLTQEAIRGLPMGNRLADATLGQYTDPVHPERSLNEQLGPITESQNIGGAAIRGLGNLMANPSRQIENTIAFPADITVGAAKALADPTSKEAQQFGPNLVKGIAAPFGLADIASGDMTFPEARSAWEHEFLGSALTAGGALRGGAKAGSKIVAKAPEAMSYMYGASPRAKAQGPGVYVPKFTEFKQKSFDVLAKRAPEKVEIMYDNSRAVLDPFKDVDIDTAKRTENSLKSRAGADELLQQERDGRLVEQLDDGTTKSLPKLGVGGVAGVYTATKVALKNLWDNEIQPLINRTQAMGKRISANSLADYWDAAAKELSSGPYREAYNRAKDLAASLRGKEFTPQELQNSIAQMNTKLDWTKLPGDEGQIARIGKGDAALRNQMLDSVVEDAMTELGLDTESVRTLKSRYGGLRTLQDEAANGIGSQLNKQTKPQGITQADLGAGMAGAYLASHMANPLYLGLMGVPKIISAANKAYKGRMSNPDVAINTMLRARRALGPAERTTVGPEVYTKNATVGPEQFPQTFDPTVGAKTSPRESTKTPIVDRKTYESTGPKSTQVAAEYLSNNPNLVFDPAIGAKISKKEYVGSSDQPYESTGPKSTQVAAEHLSDNPNLFFDPTVGAKMSKKEYVAKVSDSIKQQIKDLGGGKANTAKVAAMIGVPAAVLTKFLLGDDEERKTMLSGSAALGGLMMGTFAGVNAKNAPLKMLERAKAMEAAGIADKQIWSETGWTKGFADKQWRFEIPDNESVLRRKFGTAESYLEHPDLYKSYDVNDIPVEPQPITGASYSPPPSEAIRIGLEDKGAVGKENIIHELQHAIQEREGFAKGGSPLNFTSSIPPVDLLKGYESAKDILSTARQIGESPEYVIKNIHRYELIDPKAATNPIVKNFIKDPSKLERFEKEHGLGKFNAQRWYESLAGEAEARLTANRMNLSAAERRAQYPVEHFDVPVKDQIVRR